MNRVVVVGGSIAGTTAAGALRDAGFDGDIVVVDEEAQSYPRPSLSKAALRGESVADTATDDPGIRFVSSQPVVGHDPATRRLRLGGADDLSYDRLIIATGSRAVRLAPERDGEFVVRTLTDVVRLQDRLAEARSVVVVGGGLLGIEIASACRDLGLVVHLAVRSTPGLRSVGDHLSQWLAREATRNGITIEHISGPAELLGSPVTGIRGAHGRELTADVVITAVGDVPNVEWTPLGVPRVGVPTGEDASAGPGVWAIGDVRTRRTQTGFARDPHWYAAIDDARAAARSILGQEPMPRPARYLWTECFGHHIKMAGTPQSGPPTEIDGDPAGPHLALWNSGGRTVFAVAIDMKIPVPRLRARITHP